MKLHFATVLPVISALYQLTLALAIQARLPLRKRGDFNLRQMASHLVDRRNNRAVSAGEYCN